MHADISRLGIYIHTPFCRSKCAYCDFYSFNPGSGDVYERYANALIAHMQHYKDAAADRIVDSIFIGGGTPTAMPTDLLLKIIRAAKRTFKPVRGAEFTVEVNPATADQRTFSRLRRAGVNRISMGLQSSNPAELKALSRIHTKEEFEESFRAARRAKIENISVDLMFGIPLQTEESLFHSIDYVTRLHPEHISLYDLKIEPGTPFYKARNTLQLPDEDTEYNMYMRAVAMLERRGYKQYEISNFARPGMMCRHNLKYWNCDEYLGFGPSAHSYFNKNRFSFVKNIETYMRGVEHMDARVNITEGSEEITGRAQMGEYIMLRLRLREGVPLAEFRRRFGCDFYEMYSSKLDFYLKRGYMKEERDSIYLTPDGMFVSNYILSDILSFEDLSILSPANDFS